MPSHTDSRIAIEPTVDEVYDWVPNPHAGASRAEIARQTGKYGACVAANIAHWNPKIAALDSADIEDATRQLVEFNTYVQRVLGVDNPAIGPMSAILLRTESASSSQIEQLTTSARQLALAEIDEGDKGNARMVVGNVRAMEAALRIAGEITVPMVLEMHRELMEHQSGFDQREAGKIRSEQVWVGPGDAGPLLADFVPPHHTRVMQAMTDLSEFLAREDLPVLVQAAVAHAQFETIHPFVDGNGRTGRALVHAIFAAKGVAASTSIPISAGLLVDVPRYFRALTAFRSGDAGPIIRQFAQASRIAVQGGMRLVDDLANQLAASRATLDGVRSDAAAWRVLPLLVGQPAINVKFLRAKLGISEMTALRALETLTAAGILAESTGKARSRVWQHGGIFGVLDAYAGNFRRAAGS